MIAEKEDLVVFLKLVSLVVMSVHVSLADISIRSGLSFEEVVL